MTDQPGPSQRRMLGGSILIGAALAALGAAMASAYGVWDLDRAERLERLGEQTLGTWIAGNILLGVGIVISACGLAALAGRSAGSLARVAGGLAVVAGSVAMIGFAFQGIGEAAAADLYTQGAAVSVGFAVLDQIQEGLLILFGGLMALATLGVAIGGFLHSGLATGYSIAAGAASVLALVMLPLNIPFVALFGAIILSVGLLASRDGLKPSPSS